MRNKDKFKENRKNQILEFLYQHKLFSVALISFVIFSVINFYLILSFMTILGNI